MSEILNLIEKGNQAFDQYTKKQDSRFQQLEARLMQTETNDAKGNRPGMGGYNASNTEWQAAFDSLKSNDFAGRVELSLKAITSDSSLSVPGLLQPLAVTAQTYSRHLMDFIPQRIVEGASAVVNRIGSTDTAAVQVNQGDAKHLLSVTSHSATVPMETVAAYMKVSTQAMQDVADLQSTVSGILNTRLKATIDGLLYTAANTSGNHTAYTSTSSTAIDNIVGALAVLANYGMVGTVFLNPADYASLVLTKASTAGLFLGFPAYQGLNVQQASVVPSGKFLVTTTDGIGMSLAVRSAVIMVAGFDSDDLTRNLRTILCEQRVAPIVTDPARVIVGDLVAA